MANSPEGNDPGKSREYRDWSHDLSALQETGKELLEEWRTQKPQSPRYYPTVQWLKENGYSHLRWILREKHGMGTREFFILITSAGGSDEYEWNIDDVATIERCKAYLDDRVECREWARSTKQTNRSRLNETLRRFSNEYGDDRVIALASDPSTETEVYDTFKEVGKSLREDLISDESAHQYLRAAHRFFEWLGRSDRIVYDPMEGIEDEFRWDWSTESTPLRREQVRRLWVVAETDEEKVLVIGYCVWGVRTKELPEVHVDQLNFDANDPRIEFRERDRKNGHGRVTLMFGLDALANLLDKRVQNRNWNGYLFPSEDDERSVLCANQARQRFKALCRKANVKIEGDVPTPKHGRSFYYNILADAETDLLELAGEIAEEQGSSDAASVRDYYLTEERRREYRRAFFRERIRDILPDAAYTKSFSHGDLDSSLDDFN